MAVACEASIRERFTCGVTAVGRCARCGHGFCVSHQARGTAYVWYPDLCLECQVAESTANRDRAVSQAEAAQRLASDVRARIEKVKAAILTSGKLRFEDRKVITGYRTNHANVLRAFVGRSSVPIFAAADPAIPIGNLPWDFMVTIRGDDIHDLKPTRSGITRPGKIVCMDGTHPDGGSATPRGGLETNEAKLADYLEAFAKRHGLL